MCEFRSLSLRLFKENSPENLGLFSQCLERCFFKTKDENSPHFREQNENSLPEECEISRSELTSIEPTTFRSLVNNCGRVDALLLAVVNVLIRLSWRRISIL